MEGHGGVGGFLYIRFVVQWCESTARWMCKCSDEPLTKLLSYRAFDLGA